MYHRVCPNGYRVLGSWNLVNLYIYIKISILFFVFLEEIAILLRISFKICIILFFHADLFIYNLFMLAKLGCMVLSLGT